MADSANRTIFISRAGKDKDVAIRIGGILRGAGFEIILQDETFGHQGFMSRMDDALKSDARVIALLSPDYLASDNCASEWQGALTGDPLNRKQRLMVFRVCECAPPGLLAQLPYVDISDILSKPAALAEKVHKAVGVAAGKSGAKAARTLIDNDAIWEVPSFTGREEALSALRTALFKTGEAAVTQPAAVHGMGGVGKSALAKEYARRNRADYSIQWWFNAEKEDGIVDGLIRLGTHFIPDIDKEQDRAKAAKTVLGHVFATLDRPALLVFDNIEQPALIAKWKPHENAHVLVTSRLHGWGGSVTAVEIEEWPPSEARDYLLKESGRADISSEDAAKIAEKLGHLPLAVAHAAAFLRDNHAVSATRYIDRTDELMDQVPEGAEYPKAVYATFQQALASAEKRGPGAAAILCLCSFYAPDDIPLELLEQKPDAYPDDLAPVFVGGPNALALRPAVETESVRELALSALAAVSLIDFKPETCTFSVHRLVQAACRDLTRQGQRDWVASAVKAADATFPVIEFTTWPICERFISHVEVLVSWTADVEQAARARIFRKAGWYLRDRAQYARAEPLCRLAVDFDSRADGNERALGASISNLALLLQYTNRLADAEPLFRRALALAEKAHGPNHPEVAICLNNLAEFLSGTGRHAEAEPLYRRALAIDEMASGPDHPAVAGDLNNLAGLLQHTNRFAEAEPLPRRALAIVEKAHGPCHPTVAVCLNNLALLLHNTNRLVEAEPLYRRALAIDEEAHGPDHPIVAIRLNNLAGLLQQTNRLAEAVPMAERAAAIFRASLGEEHPH